MFSRSTHTPYFYYSLSSLPSFFSRDLAYVRRRPIEGRRTASVSASVVRPWSGPASSRPKSLAGGNGGNGGNNVNNAGLGGGLGGHGQGREGGSSKTIRITVVTRKALFNYINLTYLVEKRRQFGHTNY